MFLCVMCNNHSNTGVTLSKTDGVDCCANACKNAYFVILFGERCKHISEIV